MSVCTRDHIKAKCWDFLPDSNNPTDGCDVCPACAFEQGYRDGIRGWDSQFDTYVYARVLPSTIYPCRGQDGNIINKKSARDAYERGYCIGVRMLGGYLPEI